MTLNMNPREAMNSNSIHMFMKFSVQMTLNNVWSLEFSVKNTMITRHRWMYYKFFLLCKGNTIKDNI